MPPSTVTYVTVRLDVDGLHYWPDAPAEVSYLRDAHWHRFGIEVACKVTHDDRQVEFHLLKRDVVVVVTTFGATHPTGVINFLASSCEQIARALGNRLRDSYSYDVAAVKVSEDGNAWAEVLWTR